MSYEYVKTTWNNGASPAITAEQLNRMEDGIEDAISGVNELEESKQDNLTFDATPTLDSQNPATSDGIKQQLDLKADLASPIFTGTPEVPTPAESATQQIANVDFVIGITGPIANRVSDVEDYTGTLENTIIPGIDESIGNLQDNVDDLDSAEDKLAKAISTNEETMTATKNYAVGDLVMVNNQLYRVTSPIASGATLTPSVNIITTTIGAELDTLDAEVDEKADKGGNYPDLTAGNANQLVSDSYVSDNVPYMIRPSAGGAEIGDREIDELVGGTVAWNQGCRFTSQYIPASDRGLTLTSVNDTAVKISGTATAAYSRSGWFGLSETSALADAHLGHRLLFATRIISGSFTGNIVFNQTTASVTFGSTLALGNSKIFTLGGTAGEQHRLTINISSGTVCDDLVFTAICVDLTQMFGSTIADYVYALETATAGAGVQWFRRLFPNDYYAYDAGTLKSVEGVSAHVTRGFNQWDEEWEVGSLDQTTGEEVTSSANIRTKNYVDILPNTTYFALTLTGTIRIHFYDADKKHIDSMAKQRATFVTPENARYFRFNTASYGTTYKHDICISLSDPARDGEYEPYESHTYALDDSLTLRGILKLDSANRLYYDGDRYASDGTVTRRFGVVDLGALNWVYNSTYQFFTALVTGMSTVSGEKSQSICDAPYQPVTYWVNTQEWANADKVINFGGTDSNIRIKDTSYETASAFKSSLSGKYLVFKLATPTTETADPFTNPQIVDNLGTEEYVTTGIVPAGHETKYLADLKSKLEVAPDSPDADGDYIMRRTSGENVYTPLVIPTELPTMPSENGTYVLKVTVANGTPTLSWVSEN